MATRAHLFVPAALLLLGWGVFAFGAEFTWAYAPLLAFSLAVSALGLLAGRELPETAFTSYRPLIVALLVSFAAATLQIVPLPASTVAAVSPARNRVDYPKLYAQYTLQEYDPAAPQQPARTLSIEPSRTKLGLVFLACWSLLLISSAVGFSAVRPTAFARGVVIIGTLAAFAQLMQRSMFGGDLYGFFLLRQETPTPGAPFINRNHTAGFLVMAAALSMGHLASCVTQGWRRLKPGWRDRLLWFTTAAASETLLVTFAILVMTSAVILTRSRSGLLCLALAVALFAGSVLRHQWSRSRKALILLAVLAVLAAGAAFGGLNAVMQRFTADPLDELGGRLAVWKMSAAEVRDFPLAGTGLNTYGIASLHYQQEKDPLFIEAHNEYLQIAAEGGLLLGIPAIAAIIALIVLARRRFSAGHDDTRLHWLRVGAVIALCAIAFQSVFDFTLQMPGAAVMFVLIAAVAIHRPWLTARSE